jgi:DNA modification methylase
MKIRDRIRELRRVPAKDLRPNPRNWRTHPKSQQDALKGVLAEIGYADALLARELEDGSLMLVDGHLRAETTPDQEVPVLILDVTEAEARKILLTLDPLAGMAESNREALDSLLREIDTGSEALQEMLAELAKENGLYLTPEIQQDEVPETPEDPVTKPGDLWLLGEHRLLCGDSTKGEDVGRVLGGRKPFIMVTDPPYGVEYDPDWRNRAERPDGTPYGAARTGQVANDETADWTESYKLFPGDVAYVWHAGKFAADVILNLLAAKFLCRSQIIWVKPALVISRGDYHWQHEPCWYSVRKGKPSKWCGDRSQSTRWDISNRNTEKDNHGTPKPVECMARPIRNHGGKDDDVYDPFLGSGTTIIAAEQLNRRCYAIELEPAYVDVSVIRWQNLTGREAVREDGVTFNSLRPKA